MIVIDVKGEIIDGQYGAIMRRYFGDDGTVFSIETLKAALADGEPGDEILLNLDSVGGDIDAALHIYDYLRESGRTIHSNIVGESSSAASIICLAAPRKNRSGSNNASAVLHYTSGYVGGKVEDVQAMADEMNHYNSKIAEIYAERTGMSRKRADEILSMDKRHFAKELLEMGFISAINGYTTASAYAVDTIQNIYNGKIAAIAAARKEVDQAAVVAKAKNALIINKLNEILTTIK